MRNLRNIFACLVHERQECVLDLVRNLHALDPDSLILLYNGGDSPALLNYHFPFARYGAVVHPSPRPARWGHLHPFALDCMEWALANHPFDTFTIVDSDQLATRPNYTQALTRSLEGRCGNLGILGNSPAIQAAGTKIGPACCAHGEIELWRPFLREFADGESKWVHWFFWPSTIFLADAARDLTRLWNTSKMLREIMSRSRIWASEEVLLPTLVALLGYEVGFSPFSYDYVQYKVPYTTQQVNSALDREDVFWMHPVPRSYEDPIRRRVRLQFRNYVSIAIANPAPQEATAPRLVLTVPILQRMRSIEGWLEDAEADLLIAGVTAAVQALPAAASVVDVGSYCGKATSVLAAALAAMAFPAEREVPIVHAIDAHDGTLGAADQVLIRVPPSLEKLRKNLSEAGLSEHVQIVHKSAHEVHWEKPIAFLLIDGLHDYANVSRDFYHFEPFLVEGSFIAFHDYADYFPGVKALVDELLADPTYEQVHCAGTMMLLRKRTPLAVEVMLTNSPVVEADRKLPDSSVPLRSAPALIRPPLVSCLMPTADRRKLMPRAIAYFLRQDYPEKELIVIDDGTDAVADLIPKDPRIRYVRLNRRHTIGAKHNIGCEMANGEIIIHWDDDDWMADWRISCQVRSITPEPVNTLSGLSRLHFWDPRAGGSWEYVYPPSGRPWVAGGTFCYRRAFWETHRFPEMNEGGDTVFVWGLRDARVQAISKTEFYVALVHAQNTSRKRTETPGWHPISSRRIRSLIGDDLAFYEEWAGVEWPSDTAVTHDLLAVR